MQVSVGPRNAVKSVPEQFIEVEQAAVSELRHLMPETDMCVLTLWVFPFPLVLIAVPHVHVSPSPSSMVDLLADEPDENGRIGNRTTVLISSIYRLDLNLTHAFVETALRTAVVWQDGIQRAIASISDGETSGVASVGTSGGEMPSRAATTRYHALRFKNITGVPVVLTRLTNPPVCAFNENCNLMRVCV